jgi:hypothetical protein
MIQDLLVDILNLILPIVQSSDSEKNIMLPPRKELFIRQVAPRLVRLCTPGGQPPFRAAFIN